MAVGEWIWPQDRHNKSRGFGYGLWDILRGKGPDMYVGDHRHPRPIDWTQWGRFPWAGAWPPRYDDSRKTPPGLDVVINRMTIRNGSTSIGRPSLDPIILPSPLITVDHLLRTVMMMNLGYGVGKERSMGMGMGMDIPMQG